MHVYYESDSILILQYSTVQYIIYTKLAHLLTHCNIHTYTYTYTYIESINESDKAKQDSNTIIHHYTTTIPLLHHYYTTTPLQHHYSTLSC
jgi:hypothetical protein